MERAEPLVARGGAMFLRGGIAAARGKIRRVRHDKIEAARLGQIAPLAQIAAADLRAVGKTVQLQILPAGVRRVGLDLNAEGRGRRELLQQQHGQNARAAAEIGDAADPPAAPGKVREQHAVRAEGKARGGRQKARARPEVVVGCHLTIPLIKGLRSGFESGVWRVESGDYEEFSAQKSRSLGSSTLHSQLFTLIPYLTIPLMKGVRSGFSAVMV